MSITLKNVTYIYGINGIREHLALKDVSLEIHEHEFVGLVGHTGSGKSTMAQLVAGLLQPSSGTVLVDGIDINQKDGKARQKRRGVGLVFQYPEHQLFEETVGKDISFGPKNQGLASEEIEHRVRNVMGLVGLPYDEWHDKSPFDLSGGQKRRVALAGVLAMQPKYLILDEPTAGLDPLGRDRILESIAMLHHEIGMGIILVTHSMDDIARFANRLIVMNHGSVAYDGKPVEVFKHHEDLKKIGLGVPQVTALLHRLNEHQLNVDTNALTIEEAKESILAALKIRR